MIFIMCPYGDQELNWMVLPVVCATLHKDNAHSVSFCILTCNYIAIYILLECKYMSTFQLPFMLWTRPQGVLSVLCIRIFQAVGCWTNDGQTPHALLTITLPCYHYLARLMYMYSSSTSVQYLYTYIIFETTSCITAFILSWLPYFAKDFTNNLGK